MEQQQQQQQATAMDALQQQLAAMQQQLQQQQQQLQDQQAIIQQQAAHLGQQQQQQDVPGAAAAAASWAQQGPGVGAPGAQSDPMLAMVITQLAGLVQRMDDKEKEREKKAAGPSGLIDTRGLGKPSNFKGADWASFSFKYLNFVEAVQPRVREVTDWAAGHSTVITEQAVLSLARDTGLTFEEIEGLNVNLYTSLAQLVEGESEKILKNCARHKFKGFESWRRLIKRWDPLSAGRQRAVLSKVLAPEEAKMTNLSSAIEDWLKEVADYEDRSRKKVDEEIKTSVLIKMCPNPLRLHLELNHAKYDFFEDVMDEINTYLENKNDGAAAGTSVNAFSRDGGKGGKGKGRFDGYCSYCWAYGHKAAECRSKKGPSDRQLQNYKATKTSDDGCRICGAAGHWARECKHNKDKGKGGKGGKDGKGKGGKNGKGGKGGKGGYKAGKGKGGKKGLNQLEDEGAWDEPEAEVQGLEICALEDKDKDDISDEEFGCHECAGTPALTMGCGKKECSKDECSGTPDTQAATTAAAAPAVTDAGTPAATVTSAGTPAKEDKDEESAGTPASEEKAEEQQDGTEHFNIFTDEDDDGGFTKASGRRRNRRPPRRYRKKTTKQETQQEEINGLYTPTMDGEYELIEAAVDSGAGVSIGPKELCGDIEVERDAQTGTRYAAAGSEAVIDEGSKTFNAVTENWQERKMKVRVGEVRRLLLAAGDLVDKGNRIVLQKSGSYCEHIVTKKKVPIQRVNKIFVMKLWVKKTGKQQQQQPAAAAAQQVNNDDMDIDHVIATLTKMKAAGLAKVSGFPRQVNP